MPFTCLIQWDVGGRHTTKCSTYNESEKLEQKYCGGHDRGVVAFRPYYRGLRDV
jgi:hypothetical protein